MIKKSITYLILVLFFFVGCKKENALDCFKSTGSDITETRDLGAFTKITIYDNIDLNISKGTYFKVDVVAGKHIIKNIKTTVADGVLSIENNNKCNFVRGYKRRVTVNVTMPYIVKAESQSVGTIRFADDFTQDTLQVRAENSGDIYVNGVFNEVRTSSHGNGDIYVSGTCNRLFGFMYGTNILQAENLIINSYVFVETISIADCFINAPVNGPLEYNIWRSGNIYYRGNPTQINSFSNNAGKGQLIKLD
ncbi:MAG: DUF2807 domain-containing protein [Bacteroidota bacterium]|nr:DUF2807 domain-containing protein [Bacteroidota bacterium]MDP3144929.1 DUF2807 domain-containing protein [Bacteroidota bacterium]MDP3557058.1 DUF2807 domain-containing protein [Bacteroidota bacterium]